nr:unnamed protein product [Callosobruchus chinensis]
MFPTPIDCGCFHNWGAAAPTALSVLDAAQRRKIRLNGDPAVTCHLQPLFTGVRLNRKYKPMYQKIELATVCCRQ